MALKGKDSAKQKIRASGNKLVRALALEGVRRIVMRTPVDKGHARANWNVAVGQPDRSITEGNDAGGGSTVSRGTQVVLGDFQAGQRLFITNAVDYVDELENGSSRQAPEGMVRVTAEELRPMTTQIIAKIAAGADGV